MTRTVMKPGRMPTALLAGLSLASLFGGGCAKHPSGMAGAGNAAPAASAKASPPDYGQQHAAAIAQYQQAQRSRAQSESASLGKP